MPVTIPLAQALRAINMAPASDFSCGAKQRYAGEHPANWRLLCIQNSRCQVKRFLPCSDTGLRFAALESGAVNASQDRTTR